jgi:DUF1365 family protein
VKPGGAAISFGRVWHRRNTPTVHEFEYPVNHIWVDPDRPGDLFDQHPLWSTTGRRPVTFSRRDHMDGADRPLGPAVRELVAAALGRRPDGPVRMLTQPRTWGWLFNPITVYLCWDAPTGEAATDDRPVGALLEVTNTPWKERTTYPLALAADRPADGANAYRAEFDKALHVSPFLDLDYRYRLSIRPDPEQAERFTLAIDVVRDTGPINPRAVPVVETAVVVDRRPPTRANLGAALVRAPLSTHRVSLGIHTQAARLLAKKVPFVPHPKRKP